MKVTLNFLTICFPHTGFPGGSDGKGSACNVGNPDSVPGLGRSPGGINDNPLQYSGLENPMGYKVRGISKSWTLLSGFHFHFTFLLTPTVKNLPAMQET